MTTTEGNVPAALRRGIAESFRMEARTTESLHCEAYNAISLLDGSPVSLWMSKVICQDDALLNLKSRVETLTKLSGQFIPVHSYGLDPEGILYCAVKQMTGSGVTAGLRDAIEAERRFTKTLGIVSKIHQLQLIVGNICPNSFHVARNGDITYSEPLSWLGERANCSQEFIHYVATEVDSIDQVTYSSDVFGLGVLAVQMFTGKIPSSVEDAKSLLSGITNPPVWLGEVVECSMNQNPEQRYANASAIEEAIVEIRARVLEEKSMPAISEPIRSRQQDGTQTFRKISLETPKEEPVKLGGVKEALKKVSEHRSKVFVGLGILVILFMARFFLREPAPDIITETNNPQLDSAAEVLGESEGAIDEKRRKIIELQDSDDPAAHHLLIQAAMEDAIGEIREVAELGMLKRSLRLGYHQTVEQIRSWLRKVRGESPPEYKAVLGLLDPTLPTEGKSELVNEVAELDPTTARRLIAALILDSKDSSILRTELLSYGRFFSDSFKSDKLSSLALLMADSEIATIFSDELRRRLGELSNEDLMALLPFLANRSDSQLRPVVNMVVERELLPPLASAGLALLQTGDKMTPIEQQAIVNVSLKEPTLQDVTTIGKWDSLNSREGLLVILARSLEADIQVEAFDYLAVKSVAEEVSSMLIDWIRTHNWKGRVDLAHFVGLSAFLDDIEMKVIADELTKIKNYLGDKNFVKILLKSDHPKILIPLLKLFGDIVPLNNQLKLLRHRERLVRLAAVKVVNTNAIGALNMIVSSYDRERDPEIREAYKRFWVIQEREGGKRS